MLMIDWWVLNEWLLVVDWSGWMDEVDG